MKTQTTLRWLHFALFGLALWFFGNLYEEVILMPNWLAASLDVLQAYNRYYSVVIQYHYYVPTTQLAVVVLTVLCFTNNPARATYGRDLIRAAGWGWLGILLTALIVTQINIKLFLGHISVSESEAHRMGLVWMIGNAVRLLVVGLSFVYALRVRDGLKRSVS